MFVLFYNLNILFLFIVVASSGASSDKSILTSIAEFLRNGGIAEDAENGGDSGDDVDCASQFSTALISEFLRRTEAELLSWDQEDRDSLAHQLIGNFARPQAVQSQTGRPTIHILADN